MEFMGVAGVAAIGVIAYLIGEAVKISPADNKYIPVICGTAGALLGAADRFFKTVVEQHGFSLCHGRERAHAAAGAGISFD